MSKLKQQKIVVRRGGVERHTQQPSPLKTGWVSQSEA